MATEFKGMCTGRMVWGSVFTPQKVTDDDGNQKIDKEGKPMTEYAFGVAYRKDDPEWPAFYATLKAADAAEWPNFHDPVTKGIRLGVKFADKIIDGDGYDTKGRHRADKDGYAGCWVVNYSSQFPVTAHRHNGRSWEQITDPQAIKPGYYIRVSGSTQSNQSTQSPGMYRNPQMVVLVGYGPEIVGRGGNPDEAFGTTAFALPPGASAVPTMPSAAPPAAPTQAPVVPGAPAAPPYGGYYQQPGSPVAPAVPPPAPTPPPAPAKQWAITKGDAQYQAYLAAGWTDIQMIQQGLMEDYVPH